MIAFQISFFSAWRRGRQPARRGPPGALRSAAAKTYTVKAGDTLSAIAKAHLGSASAYMKIFELNKDQLTDPDKIKPGQVLRLPERLMRRRECLAF